MLGTIVVQNSSMAPSMLCCIVFFFMVTIVEVHMLIIDVCVWLSDTTENQTVWKVLYINWLSQNHWLLESLLL